VVGLRRIAVVVLAAFCLQANAQAEPAAPQAKRTMRIQVLGPEGKPLPKTAIHASVWTKEPFKANRNYICDENGQTTIQLPQSIDILRIWARSGNLVPLFAQWWPEQIPDRKIPDEFTFHMTPGTTIGGPVRDENAKPIENVRVQVRLSKGTGIDEPENPVPTTWLATGIDARFTNAEGRWKLENVPEGGDVKLMLSHRDYSSDYDWGAMQDEQGVTMEQLRNETAVIVMRRGIPVTGTVRDAEGKPVKQALVVWGDDPYQQEGKQETYTDSQGVYRFPPLRPAPTTLTVVAEGWAPDMKKVGVSRDNPSFDFQLQRGAKMKFIFVDRDGNPIPEVYVSIAGWRDAKSLYNHKHPNVVDSKIPRQADKDGIYEWTWAPKDQVTYQFYAEGLPHQQERKFYADDAEHVITLP
jgi:hypothetical protein